MHLVVWLAIGAQSPLDLIGEVVPMKVVAFGRNAEPPRGRVVITDDEKWAFGSSPWPYQAGNYLFRWPVDRPGEYERFKVTWLSNGTYRTIVSQGKSGGAVNPLSSRAFLLAALSKETILLGADTELFPPGAFRWEIVALSPFASKVQLVAGGGDRSSRPVMTSVEYDRRTGILKTDHGKFRVEARSGSERKPRYQVKRKASEKRAFFEVDSKTGLSVLVSDQNAYESSFKYWGNALFRSSGDGSGHDFWDRPNKRWVRLGYSIIGESADRTRLIVADYVSGHPVPATTYIVRLKAGLR